MNSEIFKLLGKEFTDRKAPFSNFFVFIVDKIESFITQTAVFLKGIYDFDGKIFIKTKEFLERVGYFDC